MSPFSSRALAVAGAVALALTVPGSALAAGHAHAKAKPARTTKAHPKPVNVRFAATGTLTSVSADSIVVAVKGGSRNVRAASLTFSVPATAKVTRNDTPATLAALLVGDHVAVSGVTSSGVLVAARVNAEGQVVVASPTPTDTSTPAPTPTDTSTPAPTPTDTSTPAPTPSV